MGEGAVVGNSTELKNVVLFNKVQVPHYNYVGDSVFRLQGPHGAGSITSNVKIRQKAGHCKRRIREDGDRAKEIWRYVG